MFRAALWSALPDQPQSGFLHTNTAWLSRLPGVVKPHAEQRLEVPGAGTLCRVPPNWAVLYVSMVTVRPHTSALMERFSPDLWATFFPGSSMVPLADVTMLVMVSASTTTRPYVRAMTVVVWCCQPKARRLAFARSPAIWS
ncbi:MAG: hypothetical protein QOF84_2125 [Streptomyces sp.]|nr:hypothetical protein [Streptomyces sp.]